MVHRYVEGYFEFDEISLCRLFSNYSNKNTCFFIFIRHKQVFTDEAINMDFELDWRSLVRVYT